MYKEYWQLDKKPFNDGADPQFYYPSEPHQAALLKLRYVVENQRSAALLTGGPGLGKTMLVHALRRQVPESVAPIVHIVYPRMAPHELLAYLAAEFSGTTDDAQRGTDRSVRTIERILRENARANRHAIVAIDEAHLLDDIEGLEVIRLLLNFQVDGCPAMTVLLVGQPALLPTLARLPALEERLAIKCLLRPLSLEETISYVSGRLSAAGSQKTIFQNEALEALFYLSQGVPRQINRMCDLALLVGFAEELPSISAEHLESVCQELVTVVPE